MQIKNVEMEKTKAEEELKQASGSASDMSVQLKNVTAKLQDTEKELLIFKVSTVHVLLFSTVDSGSVLLIVLELNWILIGVHCCVCSVF